MRSRKRLLISAAIVYLFAYAVASYLDLWTTKVALNRSGAHEGNAFVTSGATYLTTRAWIINIVGGVIMLGCIVFSAAYAARTETQWLRHPIASFKNVYLNPWATTAIRVSPLHLLSIAVAFVVMRLMAAVNNLLIYFHGFAPLGWSIEFLSKLVPVPLAFGLVIFTLFYLLAILVSPLAAKLISSWQAA